MKKYIAFILAALMIFSAAFSVQAADVSKINEYKALFLDGVGPEVNGLAVDYKYFVPADAGDGQLRPLVIHFHGMGQGGYPGAQIDSNNFPLWAGEELQSRFTGGGAYLFVPRTHEEKGEYWTNKYVLSVKAAIDEFIAANDGIDLSRIYVGGFSMGGKMTLKMMSSYPGFFAAAFPMCPAYYPTKEQYAAMADLPTWLIVSKFDVIAGWFTNSREIWNGISSATNIPEDCRLSLLTTVCFPDGSKTQSNHHVWFASANDLFMYDGGNYKNMTTIDAAGNEIDLEYPDGLISWLCSYTSSYSGEELESTGLCEKNPENPLKTVISVLKTLLLIPFEAAKVLFTTGHC